MIYYEKNWISPKGTCLAQKRIKAAWIFDFNRFKGYIFNKLSLLGLLNLIYYHYNHNISIIRKEELYGQIELGYF